MGKIKLFLQKTKNAKSVKIENSFSDKELLPNSAQQQMRSKGRRGYTDQEVYRIQNIVQKIRKELNNVANDEDE